MENYKNLFWPTEIEKSAKQLNIKLPELLKQYICQTITDSMFNTAFFDETEATHILETLSNNRPEDMVHLANKYLMLAGMFPNTAKTKFISLAFLIDTSALALGYAAVNPKVNKKQRYLYKNLSEKTLNITDVLMQTKENLSKNKTISIEEAIILKKTHNSKYANSIIFNIN